MTNSDWIQKFTFLHFFFQYFQTNQNFLNFHFHIFHWFLINNHINEFQGSKLPAIKTFPPAHVPWKQNGLSNNKRLFIRREIFMRLQKWIIEKIAQILLGENNEPHFRRLHISYRQLVTVSAAFITVSCMVHPK